MRLGWVNNVSTSTIVSNYSNGRAVKLFYTLERGTGTGGTLLPGTVPTQLVHPPLADGLHVAQGGHNVALHTLMTDPVEEPVGRTYRIESMDSPGVAPSMKYADSAEAPGPGNLVDLTMAHDFHCFLCAWTENGGLAVGGGVPGRHTFTALAYFAWSLAGEVKITNGVPKITSKDTVVGSVSVFPSASDPPTIGCEVREPGSLDTLIPVVE